jgi:hypothetical protein
MERKITLLKPQPGQLVLNRFEGGVYPRPLVLGQVAVLLSQFPLDPPPLGAASGSQFRVYRVWGHRVWGQVLH